MARLWKLAVLLPIEKEPFPKISFHTERTEEDLASSCTLDPGCAGYPSRAPEVLAKLASQLIERGAAHVVVDTWLHAPDSPSWSEPGGDGAERRGRREYLRHCLSDLFCAHATDEQLHEAFQDESSFWWQVAWELHDRGELTDEEAMRGTGTLDGHFGLIVRHAPKDRRERLRFILAERGAMEPTGALLRAAMVELESQASDLDYVDPPARLLVREALELLQAKADAASDEKPKDSAPET